MAHLLGGGYLQRLAREGYTDARSSRREQKSELAELLLDLWTCGELSAPKVFEIASAAKRDGIQTRNMDEVIRVSDPERRRMHELLPQSFTSRFLSSHRLIYKVGRAALSPQDTKMISPHALFAAIWSLSPDYFVKKLCGDSPNRIASFWDRMRGHPACPEGGVLRLRPDLRERCIPLGLHGDGVAVTGISKSWSKSVDALTWKSLLAKGPPHVNYFCIFIIAW